MVVTYFGEGCVRLQNGDVSLLVDPTNNRLKGDVVLRTLTPVGFVGAPQNEIAFAGEYELSGMEIRGWEVAQESTEKFLKTVYRVDWEEISFTFLGHLSKGLTPEVVEKIGESDVVVLPVGGGHFLSPDVAAKLVKQLTPSMVIPTFLKSAGEFLRAMGQKGEAQDKIVFKKKDLVREAAKVLVLSSTN